MAYICFNCLRQTILSRSSTAPVDDRDLPVCPICYASYRHIRYRFERIHNTFVEYLNRETRYSLVNIVGLNAFLLSVVIVASLLFWLIPRPSEEPGHLLQGRVWVTLYGFVMLLCGGLVVAMVYDLYLQYIRYQNRTATDIVDVAPIVGGQGFIQSFKSPRALKETVIEIEDEQESDYMETHL